MPQKKAIVQRLLAKLGTKRILANSGTKRLFRKIGHQKTFDKIGHQKTFGQIGHQNILGKIGHHKIFGKIWHQTDFWQNWAPKGADIVFNLHPPAQSGRSADVLTKWRPRNKEPYHTKIRMGACLQILSAAALNDTEILQMKNIVDQKRNQPFSICNHPGWPRAECRADVMIKWMPGNTLYTETILYSVPYHTKL